MASRSRRLVIGGLTLVIVVAFVWTYSQSLVPAIHPDHDHGLQSLDGGGHLRVEAAEGGRRNLVGRPDRVLILHWFQLGAPATASELRLLVDYVQSVREDEIEVLMIATGTGPEELYDWAQRHGVPTQNLYADKKGKTAGLMGVRGTPETLIYEAEGQLVHQARGGMDWMNPQVRATIANFKEGSTEHVN